MKFLPVASLSITLLSGVAAQTNAPTTPLTADNTVMCLNYASDPVNIVTTPPLVKPEDIAIDGNGDIFVVDKDRQELLKIDGVTKVSTTLLNNQTLTSPVGLTISQVHADLYIGDEATSTVWHLPCQTRNNNYCTKYYATPLNLTLGTAVHPVGLQMDLDDHLYIADYSGGRVIKRDVNTGVSSVLLDTLTMGDLAPSNPFGPHDIAVDVNTNELLITDENNDDIWTLKCLATSDTGLSCDTYTPNPAKLALDGSASDILKPSGITTDLQGTVYCTGMDNGVVAEIKGNSSVDLLQAATSGLNEPVSLAYDSRNTAKTLYISDDPSQSSGGQYGLYSLACDTIVCIPLDERFVQNVLDGECGNVPVGESCAFSCDPGHHSDTTSITCGASGWENYQDIQCVANDPPVTPPPAGEAADVGAAVAIAIILIVLLVGAAFLFMRLRKAKHTVGDSDYTPFGSVNA